MTAAGPVWKMPYFADESLAERAARLPPHVGAVAALFVQPAGCYANLRGVDPWPESRDARTYAGPHPVVAHPPCATWGRYAHKAGGKGNDGGCFASALASVRRWGGILEHPSTSAAWAAFGLPRPWDPPDAWGGWSLTVLQHWWGHDALKPTLLYVCGVASVTVPPCAIRPTLRPLEHLSKVQRAASPPAFAAWMVDVARRCKPADPTL